MHSHLVFEDGQVSSLASDMGVHCTVNTPFDLRKQKSCLWLGSMKVRFDTTVAEQDLTSDRFIMVPSFCDKHATTQQHMFSNATIKTANTEVAPYVLIVMLCHFDVLEFVVVVVVVVLFVFGGVRS